MGQRDGLDDLERGQIIYGLANILKKKRVKYFILENVKGLVNHDKGKTLKNIMKLLTDTGYRVFYKVLDSLNFGVPQMRERIYFVGVRKDLIPQSHHFIFPRVSSSHQKSLPECLIDTDSNIFDENVPAFSTFNRYINNKYNIGKYTVEELRNENFRVIDTRQSDLRIYYDKVPTLRRGRQGIIYVKDGSFKKLSGFEALLLQGFSVELSKKVEGVIPDSDLLKQAGNAMTTTVIEEICKKLLEFIGGLDADKKILVKRGSETAKNGFKNERYVVDEFNNWETSQLSKKWLIAMNYDINEIESVKAKKITGSYKSDVQVKIEIKLKNLTDIQNLQVKLVSNQRGFNQIDKRMLCKYKEMWDIPDDVMRLFMYFTGELKPKIDSPKDSRRMFANEFSADEQAKMLEFFNMNKTLIVNDVLKGRGKFAAEWMLVILKLNGEVSIKWALEPINKVLNHYGNGKVLITPRGSFKIGNITMQRKGGDNGRPTANMLQFKINPAELINN